METRANYAAIGLFTLVVIALGFGFIYWLQRYDQAGERAALQIDFTGTVSGLATGGDVYFNGIKVGDVVRLAFDPEDPNKVQVSTSIRRGTPLKTDTRAQVSYNLLTGVAYVELFGGTAGAASLLDGEGVPRLVGDPSAIADVMQGAGKIVAQVDQAMVRINRLLDTVEPSATNAVRNVETFTGALAENADGVAEFLANVSAMSETVGALSTRLSGLVERGDALVAAVDPEKIRSVVDNVDTTVARVTAASDRIAPIMEDAQEAAASVNAIAAGMDARLDTLTGELQATITGVRDGATTTLADISGNVGRALDNVTVGLNGAIASVSANLNTAVDDVAAKAGGNLDAVSGDLRRTLGNVDGLVTALDSEKIAVTVDNVAALSTQLRGKEAEIDRIVAEAGTAVSNVNAFTADLQQYRPDIEAIVADAKQLAERLNGASTRVDGILAKVDSMFAGDAGQNFFAEAGNAARSIGQLAETLQTRAPAILDGLSNFSNRGLGGISELIGDARRTLARFDRIAAGFERNPQQLIFGGDNSGVREYNRR